jgi:site-specific DNA-adenine methylase
MSDKAPRLKAPFPYFGGKSRVAAEVWRRFGDVPNMIEPFFGSGAVLLARPTEPRTETVNDIDAYVSNFWRAVQAEPDAVAELVDWPINECDLSARHKWLVTAARKREHRERMRDDPDHYDVKIAAWWCWGWCCWIGSGWCEGEWHGRAETQGVHRKLPRLQPGGNGVHRKLPYLSTGGRGVNQSTRIGMLTDWMRALSARLRRVRVCCGDWTRVLGPTPTIQQGITAVFLDPPYSAEAGRDNDLYAHDDTAVAHAVREWALQYGDDPRFRIALCGYEGEHVMPETWECLAWKAKGGYGLQRGDGQYVNKHRERVWFSPHCLRDGSKLF